MFDFEKISASKFYVTPSVERVVEFSPPDIDMQNVARVLSLSVDAKSVDVVANDSYAQVEGRTNFRLVYLDKDGVARGVDYNADFAVRVDGDFFDGDSAYCDIDIAEADAQAKDCLLLSAVLNVKVSAVHRDELDVLVNADDCYKTTKDVYVPKFLATKSAVVPFDDEKNVGGEVSAVLSLSANCIVKQTKAVEGGAKTQSLVTATVVYVEGGEIKQINFEIPFEDEFNLDGVEEGDTIKLLASVKNAKIILQGVTDDNIIRIEGELQYRVMAYRCQKVSVLDDLFLLTNEIDVSCCKARYTCFDGCGNFTKTVTGSAVLSDTKAPAIEVSALPYAMCYTTRSYVDLDGILQVEGVVNTDIIYTDENGYNSVRAEIPFTVSVESEIPFSQIVNVKCDVQSISATVKREREFEINMTLALEACGFSPVEYDYICGVDVGMEKAQNTSALSIYIASSGDDMLDVCKALTAMPDAILAQNPTLELPLKAGDKVVYFRQLA